MEISNSNLFSFKLKKKKFHYSKKFASKLISFKIYELSVTVEIFVFLFAIEMCFYVSSFYFDTFYIQRYKSN